MTSEAVRLALHRGQARVYRSSARYRIVVAGRRWGKTELEKADAMREFGTPGKVWYVAPTYDMGREIFWEPLRALIPRAWLVKDPNDSRMDIQTIWGCQFSVKSADRPDRLRGRGVRKLLIDEFQDWADGMTIWEQVLQPMLLTTNGTALITGTPKQFNHLYTLWARGQSQDARYPGWASWQFKTSDAPHISPSMLEQMRREMDPRTYRQEFEASFEGLSGRAYYAFHRVDHVRPVRLDTSVPVCISFDFNLNPATAVIGQRVGQEVRVWREVWVAHAGGEATRAAALAVRAHLEAAQWVGPINGYGDPAGRAGKTTGPSDHAVLMQVFPRASWRIPKAAPHVRDRIQAVNSRCETQDGIKSLTVDPSCEHLISDLEQVVFNEGGELDKRSNPLLTHISDALGYWVHQDFPPVTRGGVGVGFSAWL